MKPQGKQAEFIKMIASGDKYILVEAPAGTGKTYSCIQATKTLCNNGYLLPYQKVLILTFSRNARAQLLKELSNYPPYDEIYRHIDINNYHSFFKKYLDAYRDTIGIEQALTVVDDDDFLEGLLDYANMNSIKINTKIKCEILDDFYIERGRLVKINKKTKLKKAQINDAQLFVETAYEYTNKTGVICFAQFGCLVCRILNRLPEMAQAISHDYPVLILDEYQDTNYYQETFIEAVLRNSRGIFFADRYQMIYEFRGSSLERLDNLSSLYPDLTYIEFDEYFRYKDKLDLVRILTDIRNGINPTYSSLQNGKVITFSIECNQHWRNIKNESSQKAQCTILCKYTYYNIIHLVSAQLKLKKSVAILCRNNIEADRLADIFLENGMYPKTVTDTKEMVLISKHLKKCLDEKKSISELISNILSICLLCTASKRLYGENYNTVSHMDINSIKRKKKKEFKSIKEIILKYQDSDRVQDKWYVINTIIQELKTNSITNYARVTFVLQCIGLTDPSHENIDRIMLQRQYANSFSNINSGLYITTIHQSKGKEFDCVFVVDIDNIADDRNLLYVSHSRMKDALYPVFIKYKGRVLGK